MERIPEEGFLPLIGTLQEMEKRSNHLHGEDLAAYPLLFKVVGLEILCSMYEDIIPLIVSGSLHTAYMRSAVSDGELAQKLELNARHAEGHPAMYVHACISQNGESIRGKDARRIARFLQQYVSTDPKTVEDGAKHFSYVDGCLDNSWTQAQSDAGGRKYLQTKSCGRSDCRVTVVKEFVQALVERLDECDDESQPLEPPLRYCAYSSEFDERDSQQFLYGSAGSWLTALFMSVSEALCGSRYSMKPLCVCILADEPHGTISELMITRLASAYYHTGCGFTVDVAGSSTTSLLTTKLSHDEQQKAGEDHSRHFLKVTEFEPNLAKEQLRMGTYWRKERSLRRERIEKKRLELDRLRSEMDDAVSGARKDLQEYEDTKLHPTWKEHPSTVQGIISRAQLADEIEEEYSRFVATFKSSRSLDKEDKPEQ